MAAAAAASLAGVSALTAYINAKYHVGQDLGSLYHARQAGKYYAGLGMLILFLFDYIWYIASGRNPKFSD